MAADYWGPGRAAGCSAEHGKGKFSLLERKIMMRKTFDFDVGRAELSVNDNVIYIKTFGLYTDEIALEMTQHLDVVIDNIPEAPIRVWDSCELSSENFKLTKQGIEKIINWAKKIKDEKPGSQAYFIAHEPLIFGISRMYELQVSDEKMDVIVLKRLTDLPQKIQEKLPR